MMTSNFKQNEEIIDDHNDDEDEEEERMDNFLSQALPVADIKHVDLSVPPTTGEEYLSRVRLEASKCPGTVVASNVNLDKYKRKQTPQFIQQVHSQIYVYSIRTHTHIPCIEILLFFLLLHSSTTKIS